MQAKLGSKGLRRAVRVGVFLLTLALIAGMVSCPLCSPLDPWPEPPDAPNDAVTISNWQELHDIRNNLSGYYVLEEHLDAGTDHYVEFASETADEGKGWQPIGTHGEPFTGRFDGRGKTISGLVIDRGDADDVGLFGYVGANGVIENIAVEANVRGKLRVGVLVGTNDEGTVRSDRHGELLYSTVSSGSVEGSDIVGGLVGQNKGGVTRSESAANVTSEQDHAGGLVGYNALGASVSNSSYLDGTVTGRIRIGGLVGYNLGAVVDCYGTGTVTGVSVVGGVAGRNLRFGGLNGSKFHGSVNAGSYATALTTLNEGTGHTHLSTETAEAGWYAGGVVGLNEGTVEQCSAVGTVTGTSNVGGLVGANANEGTVEECSAEATVTGTSNVGGLVGLNEGMVNDSRSGGSVTGEVNVGRLVGHNTETGKVSNSDSDAIATRDGVVVDDLVGQDDRIAVARYNLTISSTAGGSVTTPGEGTFTYNEGTVVSLVASADTGYQFVNWTGDVGTIADANAASTTITMNGNYSITANFREDVQDLRTIKVGVAGDMTSPHGVNMMQGGQLAVDEIGEFTAGGTKYKFQLVEIATKDVSGSIADTKLAVEAKVDEVDFVIGGFRTEHTHAMLEVVCADNGKLFLGLGAGGIGLTQMVQDDYDNYKYFFRVLPINNFLLGTSAARIVGSVIVTLLQDPNLPFVSPADINVYILAEDEEWAHEALAAAETELLPALGVNHVGTARPSGTAGVDALLPIAMDIAARDAHVVMTLLSGPVGFNWAMARHQSGLPVISAGINSMAQMTAFGQLGTPALGEITLDTTARDVQLSPLTQPFLTAFGRKYGSYPVYTAVSAYDAVRLLKAAIQETGSLNSVAIAAAIPGLDLRAVSGRLAFYPMPAIDLGASMPGFRALSAAQAYALYGDHLLAFYNQPSFAALEANWMTYVGDWTSPPHLPQDLAYGPAVGNTAIASQWQGTPAAPVKVGVWPRQLMPAGTSVATLRAMGLFDKWGNWNFQYPGTVDILIPQLFYDAWG